MGQVEWAESNGECGMGYMVLASYVASFGAGSHRSLGI